jgi:predicted glycogen debranching enzyme
MKLPSITLTSEALSNFEDSIRKEWIVTNGLGGYASSTVLGINTRKYHGLLVAALNPPGNRHLCLAKLDEEVVIGNSFHSLGAYEFQDAVFPKGYTFLTEFSISPLPKYVYNLQNIRVHKTIFMANAKNATLTRYEIANDSTSDVKFRAFPLINCRPFHSVTDRWRNPPQFLQKPEDKRLKLVFNQPKSSLVISATAGKYVAIEKWVDHVFFREESERGESCFDDWYQPGCFEVDIRANASEDFAVIAVADEDEDLADGLAAEMPLTTCDVNALLEEEKSRNDKLLTRFFEAHPIAAAEDWLRWLVLATDKFIVNSLNDIKKFVVAGYHWFETWGRDTFISLPGLMLITGRFEDARQVFLTFKKYSKNGLIPNFVSEKPENASYNAVDATLWYVDAVLQYLKHTNDFRFVQIQLYETLKEIIESHVRGTMFDIHLGNDGLLNHGPRLTWMDAAIDGEPVTPRMGMAVEIQALWYNALRIMELLAKRFMEEHEAERYNRMAAKTRESFTIKFWNSEKDCLFDVIGDFGRDYSLGPNQIITVALDFAMLDDTRNKKIVDIVQRELLTPYGLRTLAKSDPKYVGTCSGDRKSRDRAYHNGTVWPWLLGSFTKAYLKTKGYADFRREYALKNFLLPLFTRHIFEAGLGTISEIFDGDPPHKPKGCIAQAWSVAELLRAYVEDVMQVKPEYEKTVLQDSR